jgi:hypothetical protein
MSLVRLLSKRAFFTAPDGLQVFYPFGLFTRGYVVPDHETQGRLARHYAWATIFSNGLVAPPVVFALFRAMDLRTLELPEPAYFFGVLAAGAIASCALLWVSMKGVVCGMARHPVRLSWRTAAARNAAERSYQELGLLMWICAGFIIGGLFVMVVKSLTIGVASVALGVAGAATGWYNLRLKRRLDADWPVEQIAPPWS